MKEIGKEMLIVALSTAIVVGTIHFVNSMIEQRKFQKGMDQLRADLKAWGIRKQSSPP